MKERQNKRSGYIGVASDHAGFVYKEFVKRLLSEHGYLAVDFGTSSQAPCDFPDYIFPLARAVANGQLRSGIVFGGSGSGEAMAANRIIGVRCAVCWSVQSAKLAREHNDANVLSIGERLITRPEMIDIVDVWLKTAFEGGRHCRRIEKLDRNTVSADT